MKKLYLFLILFVADKVYAVDWNEILNVRPNTALPNCAIFLEKKSASNVIFKFFQHRWFDLYQEKCNPRVLDGISNGEAKLLNMTVTIGHKVNQCYSHEDRMSIFSEVKNQFSCVHPLTEILVKDILKDFSYIK